MENKSTIKNLNSELRELDKRRTEIEEKLKETIKEVIEETAKNNPHKPKKIGKNISIMKFSDFAGKPWSQTFFDYENAVKPLTEFLLKKPVSEWVSELQSLLDKSNGGVVNIVVNRYYDGSQHKDKIPMDADFISKIIESLSE